MNSGSRIIQEIEVKHRKNKPNDVFERCRLRIRLVGGVAVESFYVTDHNYSVGFLTGLADAKKPDSGGAVAGSLTYIVTEQIASVKVIWL